MVLGGATEDQKIQAQPHASKVFTIFGDIGVNNNILPSDASRRRRGFDETSDTQALLWYTHARTKRADGVREHSHRLSPHRSALEVHAPWLMLSLPYPSWSILIAAKSRRVD